MKTNYKRFAIKTALLLAVVSISSCGKLFEGPAGPKGDTGAAGRDGYDGINGTNGTNGVNGKDGINGTNGIDGINGKDGNANVIGSGLEYPTFTLASNNINYSASISNTAITYDVYNKGIVMVYVKRGSQFYPLPTSAVFNFGDYMSYAINNGSVSIYYYNVNGTKPSQDPNGSAYRIVAISASNLAKYPDTDWRDYNQVCKVLNLNDNK